MEGYPYVLYVEKSAPDWTAIAVSFGALVVAALALILNYKLRKVPFQQALHTKQIDAFLEIMAKLGAFQDAFFTAIQPVTGTTEQRELAQVRQQMGRLITELLYSIEPFTAVLPSTLAQRLGEYARVVIDLHGPEEGFGRRLASFRAPEDMSLVTAYRNLTQTARKELGIEPLTDDTLKLIAPTAGKADALLSAERED